MTNSDFSSTPFLCPSVPYPFITIRCHLCRILIKYPSSSAFIAHPSTSLSMATISLETLPTHCPNCSHKWRPLPGENTLTTIDYCWRCVIMNYYPAWVCWSCDKVTEFEFDDDWEGICVFGACGMPVDGACERLWIGREVSSWDGTPVSFVAADGVQEDAEEIEEGVEIRRRKVERKKGGVRSHIVI